MSPNCHDLISNVHYKYEQQVSTFVYFVTKGKILLFRLFKVIFAVWTSDKPVLSVDQPEILCEPVVKFLFASKPICSTKLYFDDLYQPILIMAGIYVRESWK